jgi:hypothetical protein
MSHALAMMNSTAAPTGFAPDDLAACIADCLDCAQTCTACADACLGEEHVDLMIACITTDLNCAAVCTATAAVLSRQTAYQAAVSLAQLEACRVACGACAEECERHGGMHDHCRICAEVCRRCEHACSRLLAAR